MSTLLSISELQLNLAYHVFLPPKLPQSELEEAADQQVRSKIVNSTITAVRKYKENDSPNACQWDRIIRMLEQFTQFIKTPIRKDRLTQDMCNMETDDVLALYIRAQNAAVLVRKGSKTTIFEAFEVQAPTEDVMSIPGKLVRYYPGPAVEVPNEVANDANFVDEIVSFLAQMDTEVLKEAAATTNKAGSEVREVRDSNNPNYFVQLFFGILRGMGELVDTPRVVKRIADEVLWKNALKPWRRSPIWLIIRVAIQTSLSSNSLYKQFMVFCHADILSDCGKQGAFSSDLLHCMRIKMGRRVYKIKDMVPKFVVEKVTTVANSVETVLQSRWKKIQTDQAHSPDWDPSAFDFNAASKQTLPNSRAYLEKVFERRSGDKTVSAFEPNHTPRLENINDFTLYEDEALSDVFSADKHIALFDFEASVFEHLSAWTKRNLSNAIDACKTISSCFEQYLTAAQSYYTADVSDQSIMILTLMKLWVAIDELATHQIPLLLDFPPELPDNMLHPLLLRTSQHIEQARIVEEHLRARHSRASSSNQSLFADNASQYTFAVQYFRQSPSLQLLKLRIERDAQQKRDAKLRELREKNEEHARLDRQASELEHESVKKHNSLGDWWYEHPKSCKRCGIERDRDSMKITLHEWPLPSDDLEAQAAVFELERPAVFTIWRDTTYQILRDLGARISLGEVKPPAKLESYGGLNSWLTSPGNISARISVASPTKSFLQSHYSGSTSIPTKKDSVCVNNGLNFQLYDRSKYHWAADPSNGVGFEQYGTLSLPEDSSYRHLRYALEGTTHTSNQVLADQYDCPEDLSLHEHMAFGTLRSGPRLQWMNIVRGIQENILTFGCQEVNLLHTQAAWQIGPLTDDGSREWHVELNNLEFGKLLVSQANVLLGRVRANWLEATSVSTAIMLVTRLLASSSDTEVKESAYEFLRDARAVTFKWLSELKIKLKAADESSIVDYQNRVCEMAVICRSTFDVGPDHIPSLLATPRDFTSLITCSIILYDNKPPDLENAPRHLRILFARDQRLSHRMLPYILQADRHTVCTAISDLWPSYHASPNGWVELPTSDMRWVSTVTAGLNGRNSQKVHLNLLEGRLLIDSQPLGRLPRNYVQHPTYIRVFGQTILDVVPADSPGMQFATRDTVYGYQVSFLLSDSDNELVIQAYKDGHTFELVPFSQLTDDFPTFLSTNYHHWAHLESRSTDKEHSAHFESRTVEFRPLSQPWSSSHKWLLRFTRDGTAELESTVHRPTFLIDIHCPLFHLLACRLSPLESSRYLHVTKNCNGQIEVELPRLKLWFFVNQDMQLESKNFSEQIVDNNQSTGTMFGLKNQLVLRAKDPIVESLPRSRSVLIPHGEVQFAKIGRHVFVTIDTNFNRRVLFHRYYIDKDLGCLAGDTGLTSRLFRIYLHALTSNCLPDPLTGRTGTEEALSVLSESATSSFEQIDQEQGQLLNLIGSLTPDREYYPVHLKCMQSAEWLALPPLSQHYAFSTATASILKRAKTLQLFHPLDFEIDPLIVSPEATLLRRAARRTSLYYPSGTSGYSAAGFSDLELRDTMDPGRDALDAGWVEEGHIAAWAAALSFQSWGKAIYKPLNLVSLSESWKSLAGPHENLTLKYSSRWLKLDLPSCWIALYNLCRHAHNDSNKFRLSSCLASATFGKKLPLDLLPIVIAFATNRDFSNLEPPDHSRFALTDGYQPTRARVERTVSAHARHITDTPAASLQQKAGESYYEVQERRRKDHAAKISHYKPRFADELMEQWPSTLLQSSSTVYASWFAESSSRTDIQSYFSSCNRNIQLRSHLREVEQALSSHSPTPGLTFMRPATQPVKRPTIVPVTKDPWSAISIGNMLRDRPCPKSKQNYLHQNIAISKPIGPPADTSRLSSLFLEFEQSDQPLNCRYGRELNQSREDLAKKPVVSVPSSLPSQELLAHDRQSHFLMLQDLFHRLECSLGPLTPIEHVLSVCGVWSRITPRTLLQHLTLKARLEFQYAAEWLKELKGYAQAFVEYQRSQRLAALANSRNIEEFWKELELDTDPHVEDCNPDWLLVQIDGNFSARTIQRQVAKEMTSPSSGSSTVLQLNMGEGKSSVIVPLVAASLADTKQLVRVIVLKPLWRQMFHLLVNRLSGLVNRRVYYMPFGRHIRVDLEKANQLEALYTECMREGGILLAQPEHILSFKLMGIERLISAKSNESEAAKKVWEIQNWLTNHARDILDESDEILHVRYQLVYTIGNQQPLEGHPDRWTTTQQVLQLLARHIPRFEREHPDEFYYRPSCHGKFPDIRIMPNCKPKTEKKLMSALANDVLAGDIQNLNCARLPPSIRDLIPQFLITKELPYMEYEALKRSCDPTMWHGLLLIRGLLASGVLIFALKEKRYRVCYGLDLERSLLAVPFRAKDIPSVRAEFGHPDVAIVLTCLSYYSEGLTEDQLDNCFELLNKLDNPSLEYEQWVACNDKTPTDLRALTGVNLKDREQFQKQIVPAFSHNSAVVDFFLSSVVFPKKAKEFPHKLSASGWDLAEKKPHVTTGFSGTNDNRYLLPTSITQADPLKQLSTNALVLTYLLQPENNHYLCMRGESASDQVNPTEGFLNLLVQKNPQVRVLLDVGAQMLELQNEDLVRCWLNLTRDSSVEAAVYFNDKDELMVLPRNGKPSLFYSSPFAQQLDKCIVYLDDGHTRGTDLKLPRHYCALVTLGPKVTKDRLLQGCMRMRKLGHGQSVMFAAPPEIDSQIRGVSPSKLSRDKVDTLDVLRWAMLETCKDLQHHVSHWAQQGIEYNRKAKAQQQYDANRELLVLKEGWVASEARHLEDMYGVSSPISSSHHGDFTKRAFDIPAMQKRLDHLGLKKLEAPSMDEEQEREVSHEIERQQQVERPPKGDPAKHALHRDVRHFIQTGRIEKSSSGLSLLFHPFGSDAHDGWSTRLLASNDFLRALADFDIDCLSEYMRPVNWVVRGPNGIRVVLSPYEVNELLPSIRQSSAVSLHIYAPRVTQTMRSFSDLNFYTIPSGPKVQQFFMSPTTQLQLDLFAGQLYLTDYQNYSLLCAVLGLYTLPTDHDENPGIEVESDGFVKSEHREVLSGYYPEYALCKFASSPIPILKELIGRRRKGMKYLRTHVGQILHARNLTQNDF